VMMVVLVAIAAAPSLQSRILIARSYRWPRTAPLAHRLRHHQ
jgi:hypothetical protein